MENKYTLSSDQEEVLQEFMNVAYGSATAIIADILDAFASLSIPKVKVFSIPDFETYIKDMIQKDGEYFFCAQGINGELAGESIFLLNRSSLTSLAKYFDLEGEITDLDLKDVILELTNILSSSTVGKLAEEMNTSVSFSAPTAEIIDASSFQNYEHLREFAQVISIQTLISFKEEHIQGELIILTKDQSILWMKESLNKVIEEMF